MSDQKEFPSDKADKFVVRFPDGMRDRIREMAEKASRSMNAQIIHMIQYYFEDTDEYEWLFNEGLYDEQPLEPEAIEEEPRKVAIPPREPRMTAVMQKAIQSASDEAAKKVAIKLLEGLDAAKSAQSEGTATGSYIDYALRVLTGLDEDGNPIAHNKSHTPQIPGVNVPKRGSKRKDLPKK